MKKVITFSSKTEGRDKFCKAIQYGCRMLKATMSEGPEKARLTALFAIARDSRKMFRLGKSVHEAQTILDAVVNVNMKGTDKALQILSRSAFFVYWIFDNLGLLSSIKVIQKDTKKLTKAAMTAWFVGIVFSLILLIRKLCANYTSETRVKSNLAKDPQLFKQSIDSLMRERITIMLNIVKNLGDIIPASNGANVPQTLLKKSFAEYWIGFGGLISALISCYQTWG